MTKYIQHYNNASALSRGGNNYYDPLGRCIHFLVDMNTPVHTYYEDLYDATTKLPSHVKFENYCNELIDSLELNIDTEDLLLSKYCYNTTKDIAKNCVLESSILYYYYSKSSINLDETALKSIINSINAVCGILYKFYKEVIIRR